MNVKEHNILYNLKSKVWSLQSQVDRLEGKVITSSQWVTHTLSL